jgi:crotonobetainyl-CoA:carnitine CoA-transferase CaiB-like acyl-CoA transferase
VHDRQPLHIHGVRSRIFALPRSSTTPLTGQSHGLRRRCLRNAAGHIGIAPELGAHNDEILAERGYRPAQIEDFRGRKII